MPRNLTTKILEEHLVEGQLLPGGEIAIRIDQTLTQDATGTTAMLLFESMGVPRVQTEVSVSYVDHNMTQFGPENHDDHLYLQSIARKVGAWHSRPGNGICHQVHLERFARPGATLLGSDSHTPTAGGIASLAMGAGGLDVAVAMGGGAFYLTAPKVVGIRLAGELKPWVAAKDVILHVLAILSTKGNVGWVAEYFGAGVHSLAVPQRATITNMGAELGVTTSIFPCDEQTQAFLEAQDRAEHFRPLAADDDAPYDRVIEINLSDLEPLAAASPSPDNIKPVASLQDRQVHQVIVGSCTNSSYRDLTTIAHILNGRTVHPDVEFAVAPGSRQVLTMLAESGGLTTLLDAGARILESACGPCIGQGFSPGSGKASVRTFNRNFAGRTGTRDDEVYLVSAETAAASALAGRLTDPRRLPELFGIEPPEHEVVTHARIDDSMLQPPLTPNEASNAQVIRAASIVTPPAGQEPPRDLDGQVLLRAGDKITTDHIMPAGGFLKYRSNVPQYARFVFNCFNEQGQPSFADRALALKNAHRHGIIVAGESYGQGSSREHAALCPMHLGVRLIIARSIERIHRANLVNFAIVPGEFAEPGDYDRVGQGDDLVVADFAQAIAERDRFTVENRTRKTSFDCVLNLSSRDRQILLAGGKLNYTRRQLEK